MKVPLLDLTEQNQALRPQIEAALGRVLDTNGFILGAEVAALEKELAAYCRVKHAIGCASGTDALLLALMAFDIGAGDEVITTPYSFFATVSSITRLGAKPVFVDIDPKTYNLDVSQIESKITERTKAIQPVHLFGQCAEMAELRKIAEKHGVPLVEDAAQAIGAEENGIRAGAMSEIGCFSFYPSKNLGGMGDEPVHRVRLVGGPGHQAVEGEVEALRGVVLADERVEAVEGQHRLGADGHQPPALRRIRVHIVEMLEIGRIFQVAEGGEAVPLLSGAGGEAEGADERRGEDKMLLS